MSPTQELDLAAVLDVALTAAREAGDLLLRYFGQLDPARMERKSSQRDLVTEADVAAERILVEHLRRAFPEHAIEAEEEVRDAPDDERPRWFLDPLDGTTNFVHGLPVFCVSMGLLIKGRPVVAVVHAPVLRETFFATAGGGAWLRRQDGEKVALGVRRTEQLGEAVVATGFPYLRNELTNNNLANLNAIYPHVRGIRRFGAAALDLAFVAAGRLDAFWEQHLGPHDMAAGVLLVREAGGVVEDLDGQDDWLRGGHIVAGGRPLVDILKSYVSTKG